MTSTTKKKAALAIGVAAFAGGLYWWFEGGGSEWAGNDHPKRHAMFGPGKGVAPATKFVRGQKPGALHGSLGIGKILAAGNA